MSQEFSQVAIAPIAKIWTIPFRFTKVVAWQIDLLLVVSSGVACSEIYNCYIDPPALDLNGALAASLIVGLIFIFLGQQNGFYSSESAAAGRGRTLTNVAMVWALTFVVITAAAFGFKIGSLIPRSLIAGFAVVGAGALISYRIAAQTVLERAARLGLLKLSPICIVGFDNTLASTHLIRQDLKKCGYSVVKQFWFKADTSVAGHQEFAEEALSSIRGTRAEEIFLIANFSTWTSLKDTFRKQPLPVRLIPEAGVAEILGRSVRHVASLPAIDVQSGPLSISVCRGKRMIDIVFATSALFALSPFFLIVAIGIKMTSPGPVFFRQTRRGFNGNRFKIFKFRSMYVQENGSVVKQASRNDPRVTPFGAWLRKTSIDELPQLLNIIRGEMSIVGPRPHAEAHDSYYEKLIANYASRHHVKPGLTGWAQVMGCRGETPQVEDMLRRVEYDIWYVDHCSVLLDLKIMIATVFELFRTTKAY